MHPDIPSGHSPYRTWAEAKFFLVLAFALGLQHWNNAHRQALLRPILVDGGSPPFGGNCCFTAGYPPISHYNHCYSHYDHHSHTHCSHTPLSHTPLSHYDHCSHTMTTKWHEGSASSMSPRSPEPETHSVTRGSMATGGLGSGPSSGVHRGGRGCQKDVRGVWCVGEGKPCPQLRPTVKHNPARILVHSRTK